MPRASKNSSKSSVTTENVVTAIKHAAKRKNIPPAGLEAQGRVEEVQRLRFEYNPHLPPVLRSATEATEADKLPELLAIARQRALSAEEARVLAEALRRHEPWLEWSGKRERPWFSVEPVALHMHERISTQAILRVLAREDVERDLFADPQLDYAKAVQFYKHDVDWANRMILGDSLQVMASLAQREDLAGKVQMIYLDPPYGVKFSSNFQPELGQTKVKDREQDLTREPEMVKAYRDTWTLGIHSYLAYLRDRLSMARQLLADSGSIFVQISDENLHRVRCVMDEVFGSGNFCGLITFKKTTSASGELLSSVCDFLLWYARDAEKLKYRPVLLTKEVGEKGGGQYTWIERPSGERRNAGSSDDLGTVVRGKSFRQDNLTSQRPAQGADVSSFEFEGKAFTPGKGTFKTDAIGLARLRSSERLLALGKTLAYVRFLDDFPVYPISNVWEDTVISGFAESKIYVVQTSPKVVERCILMTTDPGDLVLDPTCGSGTTGYVAEQWGRRWITCDSSRVALVLAKHRLMTAKFEYLRLRPLTAEDLARNPHGTWLTDPTGNIPGKATLRCETVSHIKLSSIARNTSLDPIFVKHEPILTEKLKRLNHEVAKVKAELRVRQVEKLIQKHREGGANAVTDSDVRRWLLPDTQSALIKSVPARKPLKGVTPKQAEGYRAAIPRGRWNEWDVPFDADSDWPNTLQEALTAYRGAWRAKMDEVNACIAANAEIEELVDKPEPVKGVVRVTGPFTMEGVIAVEDGPNTPIGGAPDELETFDGDAAVANAEAHLDKIIRLLKASGVDFPATRETPTRNMKFSWLDPLTGAALIHAEGEWMNGDKKERHVAVSVGPEIGNVSSLQVEDVIRDANRKGYDEVVFAGFGFDAAAQDAIESGSHPKLRLHMALIRPDVAMGDLLKTQPGSQLFTVFSAPRVTGPTRQSDGEFTVEVQGMDVYDPVSNTLFPTDKQRIAAWFLDTDYDGRTFCICQAFFPDRSKWSKLAKALSDADVIDEDAFEALSGFTSLPFPRPERLGKGETWRVAVKVIDPRGNEGMRVIQMLERY